MNRCYGWAVLVSPRKLLLTAVLTSWLGGCADDPPRAPVAVPEEFDDPFAEDSDPVGDAATPATADPALALAAPPTARESSAPAQQHQNDGPSAGEAAQDEAEAEASPGSTASGRDRFVDDGGVDARKVPSTKPTKTNPSEGKPSSPQDNEVPPADTGRSTPESEASPAAPAALEPPPPPPEARFVGTYRYAGGSAQRQRLEDAIDMGVGQLNAVIRGIGRRRLNESNPIRDQITIKLDGNRVTTSFTPGGTLTATLGAAAIPWTTGTGNAVTAKVKMVKGRFVQEFKSDDGARRSVFTLDKSGNKLTLSVTVSSDRLAEPVRYALTYKRK